MRPAPRLLPLLGVAIGGVLALKALAGVVALPDMLTAQSARAEEAPARGRHAAPRTPTSGAPTPKAASPLPPGGVAAARPASPVCAQSPTELAKAAGLSPGELQTLQNLGARRGQLDDRERTLDTQIQLLAAAEAKVDGKMRALTALKAELAGLVGQQSQQQQAEVDRLVIVYSKMKPRDAAAIMATLDDRVRIPVAAKMKERNLADILSQMPTAEAKKLTEALAGRLPAQAADAGGSAGGPAGPGGPGAAAGGAAAPPPLQLANIDPADEAAPQAAHRQPAARHAAAGHARASRHVSQARRALAADRADTPSVTAARAFAPAHPTPTAVRPAVQTAQSAPRPALPSGAAPKPTTPMHPVLPAPTSASTAG